jgi:para-nitrobenzyl esterase
MVLGQARKVWLAGLVAVAAVAATISPAVADRTPSAPGDLVVRTESGLLRGTATAFTRQFRGIPYAASPSGALRLQAPRPPQHWPGVRDASTDPANCPQRAAFDPGLTTSSLDEDCLGLDVITPRAAGPQPRPVYVFIHGGAFIGGHAAYEDMTSFVAKTGVVAVTINYRVGALGFLDLPGMGRDGGNLGTLDQQAALRWVQRNIRAFGGDPNDVTLGGQSAGGGAVCAQLASPSARGLLQGAILESAWDCAASRTHAQARQDSLALTSQVGCPDPATALSCIRAVPVATILAASAHFPIDLVGEVPTWGPEAGTPVLPESPTRAFADGSWAKVPMLLGSNSSDIAGLGCQTQRQAESLSRWAPTFRYDFADETAPPLPGRPPQFAGHGAQHSAELEYLYLFNSLPAQLDAAQQDLADHMIAYWSNFIDSGDPNGGALVPWPRFASARPNVLTLTADGVSVTTNYDTHYGCPTTTEASR